MILLYFNIWNRFLWRAASSYLLKIPITSKRFPRKIQTPSESKGPKVKRISPRISSISQKSAIISDQWLWSLTRDIRRWNAWWMLFEQFTISKIFIKYHFKVESKIVWNLLWSLWSHYPSQTFCQITALSSN